MKSLPFFVLLLLLMLVIVAKQASAGPPPPVPKMPPFFDGNKVQTTSYSQTINANFAFCDITLANFVFPEKGYGFEPVVYLGVGCSLTIQNISGLLDYVAIRGSINQSSSVRVSNISIFVNSIQTSDPAFSIKSAFAPAAAVKDISITNITIEASKSCTLSSRTCGGKVTNTFGRTYVVYFSFQPTNYFPDVSIRKLQVADVIITRDDITTVPDKKLNYARYIGFAFGRPIYNIRELLFSRNVVHLNFFDTNTFTEGFAFLNITNCSRVVFEKNVVRNIAGRLSTRPPSNPSPSAYGFNIRGAPNLTEALIFLDNTVEQNHSAAHSDKTVKVNGYVLRDVTSYVGFGRDHGSQLSITGGDDFYDHRNSKKRFDLSAAANVSFIGCVSACGSATAGSKALDLSGLVVGHLTIMGLSSEDNAQRLRRDVFDIEKQTGQQHSHLLQFDQILLSKHNEMHNLRLENMLVNDAAVGACFAFSAANLFIRQDFQIINSTCIITRYGYMGTWLQPDMSLTLLEVESFLMEDNLMVSLGFPTLSQTWTGNISHYEVVDVPGRSDMFVNFLQFDLNSGSRIFDSFTLRRNTYLQYPRHETMLYQCTFFKMSFTDNSQSIQWGWGVNQTSHFRKLVIAENHFEQCKSHKTFLFAKVGVEFAEGIVVTGNVVDARPFANASNSTGIIDSNFFQFMLSMEGNIPSIEVSKNIFIADGVNQTGHFSEISRYFLNYTTGKKPNLKVITRMAPLRVGTISFFKNIVRVRCTSRTSGAFLYKFDSIISVGSVNVFDEFVNISAPLPPKIRNVTSFLASGMVQVVPSSSSSIAVYTTSKPPLVTAIFYFFNTTVNNFVNVSQVVVNSTTTPSTRNRTSTLLVSLVDSYVVSSGSGNSNSNSAVISVTNSTVNHIFSPNGGGDEASILSTQANLPQLAELGIRAVVYNIKPTMGRLLTLVMFRSGIISDNTSSGGTTTTTTTATAATTTELILRNNNLALVELPETATQQQEQSGSNDVESGLWAALFATRVPAENPDHFYRDACVRATLTGNQIFRLVGGTASWVQEHWPDTLGLLLYYTYGSSVPTKTSSGNFQCLSVVLAQPCNSAVFLYYKNSSELLQQQQSNSNSNSNNNNNEKRTTETMIIARKNLFDYFAPANSLEDTCSPLITPTASETFSDNTPTIVPPTATPTLTRTHSLIPPTRTTTLSKSQKEQGGSATKDSASIGGTFSESFSENDRASSTQERSTSGSHPSETRATITLTQPSPSAGTESVAGLTNTTTIAATETAAVTLSRSMSLTQSKELVKIHTVGLSLAEQRTVTAVASVANAVAALGAAPTAALTAERALSVFAIAGCPRVDGEGYPWAEAPLRFPNSFLPGVAAGEAVGGHARVATLGFLGVTLLVAFLIVAATAAKHRRVVKAMMDGKKKREAFEFILSSAPIPFFFGLYLSQILGFWAQASGLLAEAAGEGWAVDGLVLTFLPWAGLFTLWMVYVVRVRSTLNFDDQDDDDDDDDSGEDEDADENNKPLLLHQQQQHNSISNNNDGDGKKNKNKKSSHQQEQVVVTIGLTPCGVYCPGLPEDNKSSFASYRRKLASILQTPMGRFLVAGRFCWTSVEDSSGGAFMQLCRSVLTKQLGPAFIPPSPAPSSSSSSGGGGGARFVSKEGQEAEQLLRSLSPLRLKMSPFAFPILCLLAAISGFTQGVAKANMENLCEGALKVLVGINVAAAVFTVSCRPFVVPARNLIGGLVDVLIAVASVMALVFSKPPSSSSSSSNVGGGGGVAKSSNENNDDSLIASIQYITAIAVTVGASLELLVAATRLLVSMLLGIQFLPLRETEKLQVRDKIAMQLEHEMEMLDMDEIAADDDDDADGFVVVEGEEEQDGSNNNTKQNKHHPGPISNNNKTTTTRTSFNKYGDISPPPSPPPELSDNNNNNSRNLFASSSSPRNKYNNSNAIAADDDDDGIAVMPTSAAGRMMFFSSNSESELKNKATAMSSFSPSSKPRRYAHGMGDVSPPATPPPEPSLSFFSGGRGAGGGGTKNQMTDEEVRKRQQRIADILEFADV